MLVYKMLLVQQKLQHPMLIALVLFFLGPTPCYTCTSTTLAKDHPKRAPDDPKAI